MFTTIFSIGFMVLIWYMVYNIISKDRKEIKDLKSRIYHLHDKIDDLKDKSDNDDKLDDFLIK